MFHQSKKTKKSPPNFTNIKGPEEDHISIPSTPPYSPPRRASIALTEFDSYKIDHFTPWIFICRPLGFFINMIFCLIGLWASIDAYIKSPYLLFFLKDQTTQGGLLFNLFSILAVLNYFRSNKTPSSCYIKIQRHLFGLYCSTAFAITHTYWILIGDRYGWNSLTRHGFFQSFAFILISFEYIELRLRDIWSLIIFDIWYIGCMYTWTVIYDKGTIYSFMTFKDVATYLYILLSFVATLTGYLIFYGIGKQINMHYTQKAVFHMVTPTMHPKFNQEIHGSLLGKAHFLFLFRILMCGQFVIQFLVLVWHDGCDWVFGSEYTFVNWGIFIVWLYFILCVGYNGGLSTRYRKFLRGLNSLGMCVEVQLMALFLSCLFPEFLVNSEELKGKWEKYCFYVWNFVPFLAMLIENLLNRHSIDKSVIWKFMIFANCYLIVNVYQQMSLGIVAYGVKCRSWMFLLWVIMYELFAMMSAFVVFKIKNTYNNRFLEKEIILSSD